MRAFVVSEVDEQFSMGVRDVDAVAVCVRDGFAVPVCHDDGHIHCQRVGRHNALVDSICHSERVVDPHTYGAHGVAKRHHYGPAVTPRHGVSHDHAHAVEVALPPLEFSYEHAVTVLHDALAYTYAQGEVVST